MRAWVQLGQFAIPGLVVLLYGWLSPEPINRWVVIGLYAVAFVAAVLVGRKLDVAEKPRLRPFTPGMFWAITLALFGFVVSYIAGGVLARFPQDANYMRVAAAAVFFGLYCFFRLRVRGGDDDLARN